jgi:creatinine amidohydrolase
VHLAYDSNEFTDSGVIGDPREGSGALGEALLEAAGESLAELLEVVSERTLPAHG